MAAGSSFLEEGQLPVNLANYLASVISTVSNSRLTCQMESQLRVIIQLKRVKPYTFATKKIYSALHKMWQSTFILQRLQLTWKVCRSGRRSLQHKVAG